MTLLPILKAPVLVSSESTPASDPSKRGTTASRKPCTLAEKRLFVAPGGFVLFAIEAAISPRCWRTLRKEPSVLSPAAGTELVPTYIGCAAGATNGVA